MKLVGIQFWMFNFITFWFWKWKFNQLEISGHFQPISKSNFLQIWPISDKFWLIFVHFQQISANFEYILANFRQFQQNCTNFRQFSTNFGQFQTNFDQFFLTDRDTWNCDLIQVALRTRSLVWPSTSSPTQHRKNWNLRANYPS